MRLQPGARASACSQARLRARTRGALLKSLVAAKALASLLLHRQPRGSAALYPRRWRPAPDRHRVAIVLYQTQLGKPSAPPPPLPELPGDTKEDEQGGPAPAAASAAAPQGRAPEGGGGGGDDGSGGGGSGGGDEAGSSSMKEA